MDLPIFFEFKLLTYYNIFLTLENEKGRNVNTKKPKYLQT